MKVIEVGTKTFKYIQFKSWKDIEEIIHWLQHPITYCGSRLWEVEPGIYLHHNDIIVQQNNGAKQVVRNADWRNYKL